MINMHENAPDVDKFICFYADGSGCMMLQKCGNKIYESNGEFFGKDITQDDWLDMDVSHWLALPRDFEFFFGCDGCKPKEST